MSKSISRSPFAWPLYASFAILSACSDSDPANVSFNGGDTTVVETNVIPNHDLSNGDEGWETRADSVVAEFALAPTLGQGGNSLKTSVKIVEVDSAPDDISVGPSSVTVKPGQAYSGAAYVKGPLCGLTRFVVNPVGNTDPEQILVSQNVFLTGQPQMVEFYFQVPDGVSEVEIPVQMGFADNIGSEIYIDRMIAAPIPRMPPIQEGNVVPNSDFEESTTTIAGATGSWGNTAPEAGATFSVDSSGVAQSGNNAVRIDFQDSVGTGDPWAIEGGPTNVSVVSGWTYTFSAWVKGDNGGKINFLVQHPTQYNSYGTQEIELTAEWQEVRFSAKIDGTDVVRLYAQYNFAENKGKSIYVDNIKLIPPDTCPYAPSSGDLVSDNASLFDYNHVTNGSLEEDVLDFLGWETKAANGASADFDMQIVDKFNRSLVNKGNQSLRVSIIDTTANPADIQAGPADIFVVPGKTYIYSAFARGTVGTKAKFVPVLSDAIATSLEGLEVTFDNVWQQVTFDFTVPENAPVLTETELQEARLPADAVVARLQMAVNLGYPQNEGKYVFLDDFTLLPNALTNGDLEDGLQGWATVAPDNIATTTLDNTDAHTGNNSLRFDFSKNAANSDDSGFLLQLEDVYAGFENVAVEGGRKYYVSARFNGDSGARVKLLVNSADGSKEFASSVTTLSGGWQEVTFTANIPEDVEVVNVIAQMGYPSNALHSISLDTFRLVSQIPPPPRAKAANLVSNGNFETGATTGWEGNNAAIELVDANKNADGVRSGRYALRVSDRAYDWASAQFELGDSALTAGDSYFAAAWVKVDGAVADTLQLTLLVQYSEGDPDYIPIANTGLADTLEWTRLAGVFTFNPGRTVTSIWPYIEATNAETNYFIDELVVTKIYNINGGFESGDISKWDEAGATIEVTTAEKHSGEFSVHVTGRTENWNSVQYDMRDIGLVPGRTYLLSAWVKVDGATAETIKMTMEYVDESESPQYRTIASSSDTLNWVQLSNTFTYLPDGEVSTLKVYFESDSATASYFVDDLVITEFVPPVSVITNGDLETGTIKGWEPSGGATAISVVQWPQGGAHSGFFGLHVSGRSANWHSAQYPLLDLELEKNTSYKASVWVKLAGDTELDTVYLTLLLNNGGADQYINVASATVTNTKWTKLEGIFDYAPTGDVTNLRLYIEAVGAETSYYIDDLVVARNYAFNGGLEVSATDHIGWTGSGAANISVTDEEKQHGSFSLYVTDRAANWNAAQFDLTNSGMQPGKTYDISAWVKIDGIVEDPIAMTMETRRRADDSESSYTTLDRAEDTSDWVQLKVRYAFAFDEMPEIFKVYFEATDADSSYYVDSLVITEVDEIYTH